MDAYRSVRDFLEALTSKHPAVPRVRCNSGFSLSKKLKGIFGLHVHHAVQPTQQSLNCGSWVRLAVGLSGLKHKQVQEFQYFLGVVALEYM